MMDNGKKINFRAKELFTMKKLYSSTFLLILRIGKMLMNTGLSMKGSSRKTVKMGLEGSSFQMVKFSKETLRMIWFGAKDF